MMFCIPGFMSTFLSHSTSVTGVFTLPKDTEELILWALQYAFYFYRKKMLCAVSHLLSTGAIGISKAREDVTS
jgi:hypothetical protein